MLEGRIRRSDRFIKRNPSPAPPRKSRNLHLDDSTFTTPNDCSTMTRKPIRTRRPRIPIIQSGYCAICNLPYNSVEDHVQSKKHQKLIGEDANFIALNGYIHSDVGIESLLGLTGIEAIGFEDYSSPKIRRRAMSKTKSSSIMSDVVKSTETNENEPKHRLRSRKNINYMTPPLEDDSFQDKPDLEPVRFEYKEYRELRSSTRALAKLTSLPVEPDVWESGRPKRACNNRPKRISADERLVSDNKTYYKVEVLSNKLRSSDRDKEPTKLAQSKLNETDKGLIVKFRKLRNSELIQLNNEATNFLFPKKEESSEEDEMSQDDGEMSQEDGGSNETEEEKNSVTENTNVTSSSEPEDVKPPDKIKVEEESSMDSVSSDCKKKRKRRSHAEAFISDNQKYYKFETPGSRLRYHGSYLAPIPTKPNGDVTVKVERDKEPVEDRKEENGRLTVNMNDFTFSFETIPENQKWYQTFRKQDRSEQHYEFSRNYYWDDFVMPDRIPHLKPIDPRVCYRSYKDIMNTVAESKAQKVPEDVTGDSNSRGERSEVSTSPSVEDKCEATAEPTEDEDSKLSDLSASVSTNTDTEPVQVERRRVGRRRKVLSISPVSSGGRNPRKSPRQHASTLAILSSLIHQKRRRLRTTAGTSEPSTSLQTIPEESPHRTEDRRQPQHPPLPQSAQPSPQKQRKKKFDYVAAAVKIEQEFDSFLDDGLDYLDLEPTTEPDFVDFKESRLNVDDIMTLYRQSREKDASSNGPRKMYNGVPARKSGKRKNKTGWPKVKKRKVLKDNALDETNHAETDEDEEPDDCDSVPEGGDGNHNHRKVQSRETSLRDGRESDRVVVASDLRDNKMQPYVYVKKLEPVEPGASKRSVSSSKRIPRRTQRRMIVAPKSPRILRRPRGRWYRER
ncbi:uncharacterized protein LOC143199906 isoform X4 [Rhynchophorus ferrugineus]|uniref:uncharacterized protein LOC143199906 isoform X4 n=2 Tax=Rhynchophorus ferrugineus TaxID=354439 RepID=UPI003FCE6112